MAGAEHPSVVVMRRMVVPRVGTIAVMCSERCPGSVVVKSLDIASAVAQQRGPICGGFHSPVERECLDVCLRGTVSLVICPARSAIGMRIPTAWRPAIAAGRLSIRSAVDEGFEAGGSPSIRGSLRRPTVQLAEQRNRFVAAISDAVLILHSSPGGKLDRLADTLAAEAKPLWTLDDSANQHLITRGARPVTSATIESIWSAS